MTIDDNTKLAREKTMASNYLELHRFGQNGDYDRALKCANRILNINPQEEKALHCKIVCLIQQSKFTEALSIIQRNSNFAKSFNFEIAYCHYRLNNSADALKVLEEIEDFDFRTKELKAQVLYRLEKFGDSLEVYQDILKNNHDDYSDERETNLVAVMAQLNDDKLQSEVNKFRNNTYELSYNLACLLISQEKYVEAEKKLRHCEKLCREFFEEDGASEQEIEIELALLRVQLGYVYQKQGRTKEAQQLYMSSLKLKLDDISLIAVASNNIVVINKDQNVFDSKKKMKAATNDALIHKLPAQQKQTIALNHAIFMYYTNHFEQCIKLCSAVETAWPNLTLSARVLHALCLLRTNNINSAIELLKTYQPKNKNEKLFVALANTHFLLMQGEQLKACKVLENLGEDTYKPGVVGTLITLYLGLKKKDTALKVFENTVEWYKKNKVKEGDLSNMWRQAADFHMRNGQSKVAAHSLEELVNQNPNDKKAMAQLILAYLQFDKKKAIELSKKLPSLQNIPNEKELDSLENSNWISLKKTVHKPEISPGTPKLETNTVKKRNRKHKKKLPKNYDPTATPDPERWMPKHERTGFRKKRDRRMKEVIKGSQGTSVPSDQFDFSKLPEQETQGSPMSSIEPSPKVKPQTAQQKKGQQKKKSKRR